MNLWSPDLPVRTPHPVRGASSWGALTRHPIRRPSVRVAVGVSLLAGMILAAPGTARGAAADNGSAAGVSRANSAVATSSWSDEFNGAKGTRPDPSNWVHNVGGSGWGNQELENYTSNTSNAHLDGQGNLAIVARPTTSGGCWYGACRYSSARLMTLSKFSQKYGHIEARIKVPDGSGLWPAFWALDNNVNDAGGDPAYAENDIMELVGSDPMMIYSSLHATSPAQSKSTCVGYKLPGGKQYHSGFHVFAADWSDTEVTFSVDGHRTATRTKASYGSAWTFDQPMFLVLNLAVGGVWAGSPPATTTFPATMLVDYVRVTGSPSPVNAAPGVPSNPPGGCDTAQ
ncbi:MAG: glycoside hydrolase family 16 protein [Lapillicoccus sp.]